MNVEVLFLPPLATNLASKLCVVIDVLRATSTLATMLDAGAERVELAESTAAAPVYAATLSSRPLICGESGGVRPPGFDFGNSPREFPKGFCQGSDVLFATSNGTKAMRYLAEAPVVITGSFINATASVRAALKEAEEEGLDLVFVCSGDNLGTKFAIDDAVCAGYLLAVLYREGGARVRPASLISDEPVPDRPIFVEESANAAMRIYGSYLEDFGAGDYPLDPPKAAILKAFWDSQNGQRLARVGLAEDMDYCAQIDISERVPRLRREGERLILS